MSDEDARVTLGKISQAAVAPSLNGPFHRRLHLNRRPHPPLNELALQLRRVTRNHPIARLALHPVSELRKTPFGTRGGLRTKCPTKPLVRPLVSIDQVLNSAVFRLGREAAKPAVVRQSKENCGVSFAAERSDSSQPVV